MINNLLFGLSLSSAIYCSVRLENKFDTYILVLAVINGACAAYWLEQ